MWVNTISVKLSNIRLVKALDYFKNLVLSEQDRAIANQILKEIIARLSF